MRERERDRGREGERASEGERERLEGDRERWSLAEEQWEGDLLHEFMKEYAAEAYNA